MNKVMTFLIVAALMLSGCTATLAERGAPAPATQPVGGEVGPTASPTTQIATEAQTETETPSAADIDAGTASVATTMITLAGAHITVKGPGVTVDGTTVTVTAAGTYEITGTLDNGQIVVETQDRASVVLILNGADLACANCAPIYIANARKTVLTLASGTENSVTDGAIYALPADADEPNAAIFSRGDLTINGSGAMTVNAAYNHGIFSKDDLEIRGGTLTIHAANDGVKGRDALVVKAGTLTINAGGDGLQSSNDQDPEKGYILIDGGEITVRADRDGVQAASWLEVNGGALTIVAGGGSAQTLQRVAGDSSSTKGMKAVVDLTINDGVLDIDAADDALHSDGTLTINGGELRLASGDDGIHADDALTVNMGIITVSRSYEALESALITINGGTLHLVASDDGINVADGTGRFGMRGAANPHLRLTINGGYIYVDADGDGFDVNGSVDMTGGTVIIDGPTMPMDSAVDYDGAFRITGGFLVAVGSARMAQAPGGSSTQNSVMVTFPSVLAAGTLVHVRSAAGDEVVTFRPAKAYQSLVVSSPQLLQGNDYAIYTGGSTTGSVTNGLCTAGSYSGGSLLTEFAVAGPITAAGTEMGGVPGGGMPPARERPGDRRP
jgi:hypothetical protein